jgi:class 3 adenylate cyclase/ATP/maltotriose-dependent transcriptional regulator MalT
VTETVAQQDGATPEPLLAGREALARRAWTEAFGLLERADHQQPLSGRDLEAFAEAAFFAGQPERRIEIKERAHQAYLAEGDAQRAAFSALSAAAEHLLRGRAAIATAWARRAEPLLEGIPEGYAHGYLALVRSDLARLRGDLDAAQDLAEEGVAIGRRSTDPDLRATALTTLGSLKVSTGSANEGIALLEEAAISAVTGELSPITAGITSCQMIAACRDLTDYQRAQEWLDATDRWCARQEVSGFPGICRIHRAELVALKGGWDRAEEELRQATSELQAYAAVPPMADGLYAIGEIRRLRGDNAGAEEALREAHALGHSPQPALALIRMSEGKVAAAMASIESALREQIADQWARARLLAAQVEIAITGGDVPQARSAVEELGRIVAGYDSPALAAGGHESLGRVLLAEGDGAAAVTELRTALKAWREVGAAYEVARVRLALSKALRAAGDEDDADLELRAARDEFARLGAGPDLATADRMVQLVAERQGSAASVHRTFLFTDIVGSTKLAEALGNAAWEQLLRWHDDTLRDRIARNGGVVVNSTGDGFFAAFELAPAAVACAIEIQRSLAEHRGSAGFAPSVRIGLHAADAVVRDTDYSGVGVHIASRLVGIADADQILASQAVLDEAPGTGAGEGREITVRGVSTPIRVAEIDWR